MTVARQQICEHDIVRLRRSIGIWPKGREGTVVAEKGPAKLVEIADDRGAMLDLVSAPDDALDVIWSSPQATWTSR
jgi:hypothetical protein